LIQLVESSDDSGISFLRTRYEAKRKESILQTKAAVSD